MIEGDTGEAKRILDLTATQAIAQALGCSESELSIIWDEHLTNGEVNRIKGFA